MSIKSRIRSWLGLEDISAVGAPDVRFVVSRQGKVSTDFTHGVEILNDQTTTMDFVVNMLMQHFDMEKANALIAMAICHTKGGAVLPVDSSEQAERVAQRITAEARERSFPLVCRAVCADHVAPGDGGGNGGLPHTTSIMANKEST